MTVETDLDEAALLDEVVRRIEVGSDERSVMLESFALSYLYRYPWSGSISSEALGLPSLASVLAAGPKLRLVLLGSAGPEDVAAEGAAPAPELARQRAWGVRDLLVEQHGVPAERLEVREGAAPGSPGVVIQLGES